ncbi:MAG: hypothetical protein KC996_08040 [Phycisphaerales bacterium]|nr:hypothetical protein [Phycisphaerales bacterium]
MRHSQYLPLITLFILCAHASAQMTNLSAFRYAAITLTTSDDPTSTSRLSQTPGLFQHNLSIWGDNPLWGSAAAALDFDSNLTASAFDLQSGSTVEADSFSTNRTRSVSLHFETIRFTLLETTTFELSADMDNDAGFSGSTYVQLAYQDPTLDPIYREAVVNASATINTSFTLDPGLYEFEFWGSTSVVEETGGENSGSFNAAVTFHAVPAPSSGIFLAISGLLTTRRRRCTR